MRTGLWSLLVALPLCAGCFPPSPYIVGSVSYTTASPTSSSAAALPLRAIACRVPGTPVADIRIGDHCILKGPLSVGARGASFTGRLASVGSCALPGANGDTLNLQVASATYTGVGEAVDTTIGGTTDDGRYVTYRFTGTYEAGPRDTCDKLEGVGTQPPTDGRSRVSPGREAWEGWNPDPPSH